MKITVSFLRDVLSKYDNQQITISRFTELLNERVRESNENMRIRIDLNEPAELAIRKAVDEVEHIGAHPLLTNAVILLNQARELVADFIDEELKEQP